MSTLHGANQLTAAILALGLAVSPLAAQQAPSAADDSSAIPVIRVSSKLVLVDVVATDKQHHPITDLKATDFAIYESGKQQRIVVFQSAQKASGKAPQLLPEGIYSNRPEFRAGGGSLSVLLIDAVNTPFKDQAYARQQMLKWVAANFQPGNRMAIYALTTNLRMLQDFTSDPKVLKLAIEQYRPSDSRLLKDFSQPVFSQAVLGEVKGLDQALAAIGAFYDVGASFNLERRTEITADAFKSLARTLGGLPGRKSIIWMSAGLPFSLIPEDRDLSAEELASALPSARQYSAGINAGGTLASTVRQAHTDEIKQAAAQLASAQVAVYPVDVRGLVAFGDAGSRQLLSGSEGQSLSASQETMRDIARQTGGRAYINQNEVGQAIPEALADNDAAYTIGYYPENKKWDSKYRELKVKLARADAELRYRNGYYAFDPNQGKGKGPDNDVANSLQDDPPATLVGFTTTVRQQNPGKVTVLYQVDAKTLSFDKTGDKEQFSAIFFAVFYGPDGKLAASGQVKVEPALGAADYATVMQQGMVFPLEIASIKPGKYIAHIGVKDNKTGFIGTVKAPVEVK